MTNQNYPRKFQKPPIEDIRKKLTPEEFKVTQEEATEAPYRNEYWNFYDEGLYVDKVTGEPLFTSLDKYDASCGWPSFSKPIQKIPFNIKKITNSLNREPKSDRASQIPT